MFDHFANCSQMKEIEISTVYVIDKYPEFRSITYCDGPCSIFSLRQHTMFCFTVKTSSLRLTICH